MKFIIRPIWNLLIGYSPHKVFPSILIENFGQYPYSPDYKPFGVYRKSNHDFAYVYIDNDGNEITYENYLKYLVARSEAMKRWRDKMFKERHGRWKRFVINIHYWLNPVN